MKRRFMLCITAAAFAAGAWVPAFGQQAITLHGAVQLSLIHI